MISVWMAGSSKTLVLLNKKPHKLPKNWICSMAVISFSVDDKNFLEFPDVAAVNKNLKFVPRFFSCKLMQIYCSFWSKRL